MIKKFLEWIGLKQKIHESGIPHFYNEGEVWWCAIGENVGVEINGKGGMFSRPVLVYKKLSRNGFMAVPLSTKTKEGSWFIKITFQGKEQIANIAQHELLVLHECMKNWVN